MTEDQFEIVAKKIVNASFIVHKEMGPGLLESVYELCLIEELKRNDFLFKISR